MRTDVEGRIGVELVGKERVGKREKVQKGRRRDWKSVGSRGGEEGEGDEEGERW